MFVKPVITAVSTEPPTLGEKSFHVVPAFVEYWYFVIGDPPVVGTVHDSVARVLPGAAPSSITAPGAAAGVTAAAVATAPPVAATELIAFKRTI